MSCARCRSLPSSVSQRRAQALSHDPSGARCDRVDPVLSWKGARVPCSRNRRERRPVIRGGARSRTTTRIPGRQRASVCPCRVDLGRLYELRFPVLDHARRVDDSCGDDARTANLPACPCSILRRVTSMAHLKGPKGAEIQMTNTVDVELTRAGRGGPKSEQDSTSGGQSERVDSDGSGRTGRRSAGKQVIPASRMARLVPPEVPQANCRVFRILDRRVVCSTDKIIRSSRLCSSFNRRQASSSPTHTGHREFSITSQS